jgi:hypothetical protein
MHDIQIIVDDINLSIRKILKKYSTLPNYRLHQNQKKYAYCIENQNKCPHAARLHHKILYPIV